MIYYERYGVAIGSQQVDLPIIPINEQKAISLLMTIDRGVRFLQLAGAELAGLIGRADPEIIVAPATLGIPVAIEVSRALGLDDYLILQKTPKIHLANALSAPLRSITTGTSQRLLLDIARRPAVESRRVAFVDDVISTGSSTAASLSLLRSAGADIVAVGALLTEGIGWKESLGADAGLVQALGRIPVFVPAGDGWVELWE